MGRRKGVATGPTRPREGSLTAWLQSFTVGEVRYVEASAAYAPSRINSMLVKSPHLTGYRFTTRNYVGVHSPTDTVLILRVERLEDATTKRSCR